MSFYVFFILNCYNLIRLIMNSRCVTEKMGVLIGLSRLMVTNLIHTLRILKNNGNRNKLLEVQRQEYNAHCIFSRNHFRNSNFNLERITRRSIHTRNWHMTWNRILSALLNAQVNTVKRQQFRKQKISPLLIHIIFTSFKSSGGPTNLRVCHFRLFFYSGF